MSKPLISPDCVHAEDFRCKQCLDWQRERRDAWVRFAAARGSAVMNRWDDDERTSFKGPSAIEECADFADQLLAEFDARFGKKEEGN